MQGLGILLLIVAFFVVVWPYVSRWLKRKAMEKAEDYMRASMGMPPRDKRRSRQGSQQRQQSENSRQRRNPFGPERYTNEPLIPKEYAEDVEFTETIDYSQTEIRTEKSKHEKVYHESQISDAEFTEIKKYSSK